MEGPQVKIALDDLTKALRANDGHKKLKALAKEGLKEMAVRHQVDENLVLPLLDELVEKVVEESKKFNPKLPYPAAATNNMSVQIEMPTKGKVGVVEMNSIVKV